MKRAEEVKTPIGQAAFCYYKQWMSANKRMVPHIDTFLKSHFYISFIRFVKHTHKTRLPAVDKFIKLMVSKSISPTQWSDDNVYAIYIEYLDRRSDPTTQASISIKTLFSLADAAECELCDVLDMVTVGEITKLFQQRRLSPWLMLFSSKFKNLLINKTTPEQRIVLESIIRPQYWADKFKKHPNSVIGMKKYIDELGI